MSEEVSVSDLVEQVRNKGQEYSSVRKEISKIKEELRNQIEDLFEEDLIDPDTADKAFEWLDRGEYEKVEEVLENCDKTVKFSSKDISNFAEVFGESLEKLDAKIEQIRASVSKISIQGMSRKDAIAYLYGKHSSLRKSDIKNVFSAIDKASGSLSIKEKARLLQSFEPELNIRPTVKVLKKMNSESRGDS